MSNAIPITRHNIHLLAEMNGVSAEDLDKKVFESQQKLKKKQDIEWACDFFNETIDWYQQTMTKIREIEESLPKEIDRKEKKIKMFGWIKHKDKLKSIGIPLQENTLYSYASAVELILTNPDLYLKMRNWD